MKQNRISTKNNNCEDATDNIVDIESYWIEFGQTITETISEFKEFFELLNQEQDQLNKQKKKKHKWSCAGKPLKKHSFWNR